MVQMTTSLVTAPRLDMDPRDASIVARKGELSEVRIGEGASVLTPFLTATTNLIALSPESRWEHATVVAKKGMCMP